MDNWKQRHRDAAIETGFWLAVVMLILAVVIGVVIGALAELFLPPPPPAPVSTHALQRLRLPTP